jgi:hypothetical protein
MANWKEPKLGAKNEISEKPHNLKFTPFLIFYLVFFILLTGKIPDKISNTG